MTYGDGGNIDSSRSLFEYIINENMDDLIALFQDDTKTLKRIDEVEKSMRPQYNQTIESVEEFH